MKRKNNKKGFTLIELIVVLAILAILAAIIVPTTFGAITNAKKAADNANLDALNSAVRMQRILDQAKNPVEYSSVTQALSNASIDVPADAIEDPTQDYIFVAANKRFEIGTGGADLATTDVNGGTIVTP